MGELVRVDNPQASDLLAWAKYVSEDPFQVIFEPLERKWLVAATYNGNQGYKLLTAHHLPYWGEEWVPLVTYDVPDNLAAHCTWHYTPHGLPPGLVFLELEGEAPVTVTWLLVRGKPQSLAGADIHVWTPAALLWPKLVALGVDHELAREVLKNGKYGQELNGFRLAVHMVSTYGLRDSRTRLHNARPDVDNWEPLAREFSAEHIPPCRSYALFKARLWVTCKFVFSITNWSDVLGLLAVAQTEGAQPPALADPDAPADLSRLAAQFAHPEHRH